MRRSRIVRPKGSTRSMGSGYRQQHRGDGATCWYSISVRHDRDGVSQRCRGKLVAALGADRLHVVATVVAKTAGNSHVMSLAVHTTRQTVVGDRDNLGAFELGVSGHLAQRRTGEQLEADQRTDRVAGQPEHRSVAVTRTQQSEGE